MTTAIYTLTHKDFEAPKNPIYHPLSVFCDKGDNIAGKNCYYSELTGCYWAYKNAPEDILGIAHYRRYLINERGTLLSESEIQKTLNEYDMLTPKILTLNFPYEYGFSKNHKPYYLEELSKLLMEKYPEVYPVYSNLIKGVNTLFGNMLIARRSLFIDYHEWLFSILFDLENRIEIDEPDSYHRRIFGFISEFLLYVYVKLRGLRIKEHMVGMVGEKTEVRTLKRELWDLLSRGDFMGAKAHFLDARNARPDILMEASDIGWELHYLMEAIAILEHERDEGIHPFIEKIGSYEELIAYLRNLNSITREHFRQSPGKDLNYWALAETKGKAFENYSAEAIRIAATLVEAETQIAKNN